MKKLALSVSTFAVGLTLMNAVAHAQPACCVITAIDSAAITAKAKVNASGQMFLFRVADRKLFATLRVGQPVYANFRLGQVSLDGRTICCSIVGKTTAARGEGSPAPPAESSSRLNLAAASDLSLHSGWVRHGRVISVTQNVIQLAPLTGSALEPSPVSAAVKGNTNIAAPPPSGQIRGTTRIWTAEALQGFEGSVVVFLLDENDRILYQTTKRHWGVNGEAIPGAPSDRKEDWVERVPQEVLAQTRRVVIDHSDDPTSHWEDTLTQVATDAGIVVIAVACGVIGNEFVYTDSDNWSCQPASQSDSMAAARAAGSETVQRGLQGRPTSPLPQLEQIVWVNPAKKQVAWTRFPISAHRKDDVGSSHYMETWVAVSYPVVPLSAPH